MTVTAGSGLLSEIRFRVMGTDAHLVAFDAPSNWDAVAHAMLDDLEDRWSRFRADSEVSRLNAAKELRPASAITFALLEAASDAVAVTGGRFDPTVHDALVAAGYDADFAAIRDRAPVHVQGDAPAASWTSVELDRASGAVVLHDGVSIDLGGIAKGFAADLVAGEVLALGAGAVLVNVGGDLRCTARPDGIAWRIAVDDPFHPGTAIASVALGDGALATSTSTRRHWQVERADGTRATAHHIIDPATGQSALTDVAAVTVVASEAVWAEPLTKGAFVAGADAAIAFLDGTGVAGLVVTDTGKRRATNNWKEYAR
jgi:thiamine biosynthesis lipoprotein